jgi:hypothetical protein
VGVVLCSGLVVYITASLQELTYHVVYLPGSVEGWCTVKDGIITTDGLDLWYSKLTWHGEGQPVMENRVLGIKGVCALDVVPHSDIILAVTVSTITRWETKYLQHKFAEFCHIFQRGNFLEKK